MRMFVISRMKIVSLDLLSMVHAVLIVCCFALRDFTVEAKLDICA